MKHLLKVSEMSNRKKRTNVKAAVGSYGDIIKKIEGNCIEFGWMAKSWLHLNPRWSPRELKGSAGSGKQIVLALKAAFVHAISKNFKIEWYTYTEAPAHIK